MIITEPKKLSLPQQVEKNRLDIKALMAAAILLGSIIEIDDLSHILTTEELALANKPVSFITYNNEVYAKSWTDDSDIYFLTEVKFNLGATTSFLYKQIKVSINSGQLTQEIKSFSTYSAAVLDLGLAQKANLSGASFTGGITAPSIIEDMTGYGFTPNVKANITNTYVYTGAVKTGNKLTLVIFGKATRSGDVQYDFIRLGDFILPTAVLEKLIPTPLGDQTASLMSETIHFFRATNSKKDCNVNIQKTNSGVVAYCYGVNSLDLDTEYQYRLEATFLLTNSLI